MLTLANELNEAIADADIPEYLRSFVFEHLSLIRNALEEYKILGVHPIEAELERITGAVVRNPEAWTHLHKTRFGKRFWSFCGKLAIITTISVGQLQIGHEVFNALSPNEGQSAQTTSTVIMNENINTNIAKDTSTKPNKNSGQKK